MPITNRIIVTLHVPSIEETAAWYVCVLGWEAHFDTFDEAGQCLFGSTMLDTSRSVDFNLSRSAGRTEVEKCTHSSSWIYVEDVEAVYRRVLEQGWPVEKEIEDKYWGERVFELRDKNGNHLIFAQQIEDIGLEAIRERHREMLKTVEDKSGG